jgi:hypothetical protein
MLEIECTCANDDERFDNKCPGCQEYRYLDFELHREMKLQLWQGPALVWPDETPTHPPSTGAGEWQRLGGPELYQALCKAAGIAN